MSSQELFEAIRDGNIERVRAALAAGADPNAFKRVTSRTPGGSQSVTFKFSSIHAAVVFGRHEVVPILVAGGGDANLRLPDGYANQSRGLENLTPLMLALQENNCPEGKRRAVVAALIAAGAEVDATVSPYDWTAFTEGLVYGFRASLLELLRAGATIVPSGVERTVRNEACFALLDKIDEAGDFDAWATRQRAVPVAILRKIFSAALPCDVLPIVATFWMPRGGF